MDRLLTWEEAQDAKNEMPMAGYRARRPFRAIYRAVCKHQDAKTLRAVGKMLRARMVRPAPLSMTQYSPHARLSEAEIEVFERGEMPEVNDD